MLNTVDLEYLCVAAEITTATLLLSLMFPGKVKTPSAPPVKNKTTSEISLETIRSTLLSAYLCRGLAVLRGANLDIFRSGDLDLGAKLEEANWIDRITGEANQLMACAFVDKWLEVESGERKEASVMLLTFDNHHELLEQHGAMQIEIAIRSVAIQLRERMEPTAIIARFPPDKFLVIQFGTAPEAIQEQLILVNDSLRDDSGIPTTVTGYIMGVPEGDVTSEDVLTLLEKGLTETLDARGSSMEAGNAEEPEMASFAEVSTVAPFEEIAPLLNKIQQGKEVT